ncbi:MAG: RNA polymerase sigma factor [Dehalococcoidia bacterium]
MLRSTSVLTDESELIARAKSGDKEAFGRLYEEHAVRVFRHAYFLTGEVPLAEDLTAQAFLRAMEAMPRYEDRGVPFVAWLLRITANLAINYRKAQKNGRHAQLPETLEDDDALTSPETCCTMKSEGDHVWQKVRTLPLEQRQVIVMRFMDDLPYSTVAQVLGKSVGAVRVIQFRALSNLRNILRDDELAAAYQHARAS